MNYEKKMEILLNKKSQSLDFLVFAKKIDKRIADLELWIRCLKLKITEDDLFKAIEDGKPRETMIALDIDDEQYFTLKRIAIKRRIDNENNSSF
ncbi:hypothetical protein [Aliikangiella maris]|uniref:Uncharacterized protein n=2 Tax=Aliikangiella maris TaxID=3162458 RepID=A0ABV3MJL1_9GAMM